MNNYFHDVATAMMFASAFVLWKLLKHYDAAPEPKPGAFFVTLVRSMRKLVIFSVVWICLGGIPRLIYYKEFEWQHFADKAQIPALIVKHIFALAFVIAGSWLLWQLRKRVKVIEAG